MGALFRTVPSFQTVERPEVEIAEVPEVATAVVPAAVASSSSFQTAALLVAATAA